MKEDRVFEKDTNANRKEREQKCQLKKQEEGLNVKIKMRSSWREYLDAPLTSEMAGKLR